MEYLLIMFLVIVTIFLGKVGTWFGFSEVVGQLFSGIILGSSIFNIVQSSNLIHLIAEIGIFTDVKFGTRVGFKGNEKIH